jgi:hypothetical protein
MPGAAPSRGDRAPGSGSSGPSLPRAGCIRHRCGDWGDLGTDDKQANDLDLKDGGRLLSRYDIEAGSF